MAANTGRTTGQRQNTSGGSAGAGGYGFQAEAGVYIEAKILAEDRLDWANTACDKIPVKLLAETGGGGDDLQVHLASGATIEVQAKVGIQQGTKFWIAIIDLARAVNSSPNVYGVLLTNDSASGSIRHDLKNELRRVAAGRSDNLKPVTKQLVQRLKAAGISDVATCCARMRIITLDLEPDGLGLEVIRTTLDNVVFDKQRVLDAHDALSKDSLQLIIDRGSRNKKSLEHLLTAKNISLTTGSIASAQSISAHISQLQSMLSTQVGPAAEAQEKLIAADLENKIRNLKAAWQNCDREAAFVATAELRRWINLHTLQLPAESVADAYTLIIEVEFTRVVQQKDRIEPSERQLLEELTRHGEDAFNRASLPTDSIIEQRLVSLKALVESLFHGADRGLSLLAGRENPYAIRRRLTILIRAERFTDGLKAISDKDFHPEWAERASLIFSQTNQYEEVFSIIRWAKTQLQEPLLALRCAIAAADVQCGADFMRQIGEMEIRFETASPSDEARLKQALEFLSEVTGSIKALNQIRSIPEFWAMHREGVILAFLGQNNLLVPVITALETWKPFPILLPVLVQIGVIPCSPEWPERLRKDYPEDYNAALLAAMITPETPENIRPIYDSLLELAKQARENILESDRRRSLYFKLEHLATILNTKADLGALEQELLGDDEYSHQLMRLIYAINQDQFDEARPLLTATENESDGLWLQCRAALATHDGKPEEALIYLQKALSIRTHIGLLRLTADAAIQSGNQDEALLILERYLQRKPGDTDAHHQVAMLYVQKADFVQACEHFGAIWQKQPENVNNSLNYALSLASAGDSAASLNIYESVCEITPPPLPGIISRSKLLRALGHPKDAFKKLIGFRDLFWEEPQYLMAVSEFGSTAQEDRISFEALMQVRRLQSEGRAPEDIVQTFWIDEITEFFVQQQNRAENAKQHILQTQLPWLTVDRILNQTAIGAWYERTRSRTWVGETPYAQASTAIYATNGYYLDRRPTRTRAFRSLPTPQKQSPIVADLSSLITLHQLGLLNDAATFFGKIHVPSIYLPTALEEAGRLAIHQPSRKVELEAIRDAIESEKISSVSSLDDSCPRVTELEDSESDEKTSGVTYSLSDVLSLLHERGFITVRQMQENSHLMHQASLAEPRLVLAQELAINLTTLRSLAGSGLLEPFLRAFSVSITQQEKDSIAPALRSYRVQEELLRSHQELWNFVRTDSRLHITPWASPKPRLQIERTLDYDDREIAAPLLAQELALPLLTDDRVCQNLIYSDPSSPSGCYAFGTDRLLALWTDIEPNFLDCERVADKYLQLIRWRYRFLLPPASLLKTLAMRHIGHLPGEELREIALYVHACMRDSGLSLEQASETPTSTIGNWLFVQWIYTIIEFICLLWKDESISLEQAETCTRWALQILMPSPPKIMGAAGTLLFGAFPRHVLGLASIGLMGIKDKLRGHHALSVFANSLGISKAKYARTMSEVIRGF